MWVFKRLQKFGEVSQTLVTVTMQVNMGRRIPQTARRGLDAQQLIGVSLMRQQFDKSIEVDGVARAQNVLMISNYAELYSVEETRLIAKGEKHFADFKEMKAKNLKMSSPLTKGEIAFKKKGSFAWGRATTTVRARPEEVLAFFWDTMELFTYAWQSSVPKEWIEDVEERARLDQFRENGRRRSSVEKVRGLFGKGEEEGRGGVRVEPVAREEGRGD